MDKQEYRLKTEQMLKLANEKSYREAMEIAEQLDWKKMKNTAVLCVISEIYEANGKLEKAHEILIAAYERASDSKKIIYRLALLAIKLDDMKEATECYEEFIEVAPKDPNRYILKYKILKAKGASVEEQIEVLEEFKRVEYIEKWAYELALLYQKAGMISECIDECDDLVLWFSEGKFVQKAMELKMQYKPLTPLQRERYESENGKVAPVVAPAVTPVVAPVAEETPVTIPAVEPTPVIIPVVEAAPAVEEAPVVEEVEVPEVEETLEAEVLEVKENVMTQATKPLGSIEEMVQEWQAQQKENAQMIQAKLEEVEAEKAAQKSEEPEVEEKVESILPDDIRMLMEELEAESADIEAKKTRVEVEPEKVEDEETPFGVEESKPLFQKVVDIIAEKTMIEPAAAEEVPAEKPEESKELVVEVPEEEDFFDQEVFEKVMAEALGEVGVIEESDGIKLGDTQSMALATRSLENAVKVDPVPVEVKPVVAAPVPEVKPVEVRNKTYDTGFIVKGKYDLEAQSAIGIKAGLTEEQKKLFSYFVPVHGMSEQLVEVLQNDKNCKDRYGTSRIGNIVVVGRKGSGKTVLAVDLVKAIQKGRGLKQGKVAIVTAESMNRKDVNSIVSKLFKGALIIENASGLNRRAIEELCEAMEGQTGELLVVLEDERQPLMDVLAAYPNFKKKFTSQIEVPVFINDELVTFGQTYAKENGYKIDEMGILALYSRIDLLQREEKVVTVASVKEVIDDAIANANGINMKNLMKKVFGKNKDDKNRVILTEEDFR